MTFRRMRLASSEMPSWTLKSLLTHQPRVKSVVCGLLRAREPSFTDASQSPFLETFRKSFSDYSKSFDLRLRFFGLRFDTKASRVVENARRFTDAP